MVSPLSLLEPELLDLSFTQVVKALEQVTREACPRRGIQLKRFALELINRHGRPLLYHGGPIMRPALTR